MEGGYSLSYGRDIVHGIWGRGAHIFSEPGEACMLWPPEQYWTQSAHPTTLLRPLATRRWRHWPLARVPRGVRAPGCARAPTTDWRRRRAMQSGHWPALAQQAADMLLDGTPYQWLNWNPVYPFSLAMAAIASKC